MKGKDRASLEKDLPVLFSAPRPDPRFTAVLRARLLEQAKQTQRLRQNQGTPGLLARLVQVWSRAHAVGKVALSLAVGALLLAMVSALILISPRFLPEQTAQPKPGGAASATPTAPSPTPTSTYLSVTPSPAYPQTILYTVQAGDRWDLIAAHYGMTVKDLLALNHRAEGAALVVGEPLVIITGLPWQTPAVTEPPAPTPDPLSIFNPFDFIQMSPGEQDMLRLADMELTASLPASPQQVMLYRQKPYDLPLTAEQARAVAAQLGIQAEPTPAVGEGGDLGYSLDDGKYSMRVFAGEPPYFIYVADAALPTPDPQSAIPFNERARMAVDFLKAHGLLGFDYEIEPGSPSGSFSDGSIAIEQKIDGKVLYENDLREPRITVVFDEQRQVDNLMYRPITPLPGRLVAIRPAAEVWNALRAHSAVRAAFRVYELKDSHGSLIGNSVPYSHKLTIDRAELAYYALDLATHGSLNPPDYPGYQIVPVWRFTGDLADGRRFEIITEAAVRDTQPEK